METQLVMPIQPISSFILLIHVSKFAVRNWADLLDQRYKVEEVSRCVWRDQWGSRANKHLKSDH